MGRTPLPAEPLSVATMADDAAALLRALEVPATHVAGYSGGSLIAQELALRHPELVRSLVLDSTWARPDAYFRATVTFWRWLAQAAPSERAFLEAFYLWIYTPRAHGDGTVEKFIEEVLAFPHKPSTEAIQRSIDAFLGHDTADRLSQIAVPTLVVAGGLDRITPPSYGRAVADAIPGAQFEVLAEEAHQPFQEVPDLFNATVDTFWHQVEARGGAALRPPALPPARRAGVMSGSASAPTRVPAAGQGKNVRWVSLPRWALAHGCPVAGSRSTGNASRTDAA
jgi:pimeloyl-ACP methyl ester carboxylesterase